MEKKPLKPVWIIGRILFVPTLLIVFAVIFFFAYNTYLIDTSLEDLKFSLNKVSSAKTLDEAKNLRMLLGEVLIKEVSAEKLDVANLANLEFGENIISEGKINDQLKDLKLILSNVVRSKESKRSKILLKLDEINEKIKTAILQWRKGYLGKTAAQGIEVADLSLLNNARKFESKWLIEDAIGNYLAFLSQYPTYKDIAWVKLRLGYAYLKVELLKDAERIFAAVEKDYFGKEEANVARKFLGKIAEIKRSVAEKETLLSRAKSTTNADEKMRVYYNLGVLETYNYNLAAARDFFKKVIEIDPKSTLAQKSQFNIGWSLKFQNDLEKSALVFEDIIKLYSKGDIVLNAKYQLADTYHKSGKYQEAIAIYKKIAQDYKDKPIAPLAQFQAGYSYLYNLNDPVQASDAFKTLGGQFQSSALASYASMDLVPTLESRFRDFAFSLLIEGKYEKAKEAFIKAIEANKNDAWAHAGLSGSYVLLGDLKQGFTEAEAARNILEDMYTCAMLAFNFEMEGKLNEAIDLYKKSIAKDKEYLFAHYNIARLYVMQARYDEAIAEYNETIRIDPKFCCGYKGLGYAYWFKGEVAIAIQWYQKALALESACPDVHYNLGLIYKVLGRKEEAKKEFEESLKGLPSLKEAGDELANLVNEGPAKY